MPTSSCLIVCERSRRKGRRSRSNITGRVRDSRRHRWAYNIPIYFVKKYFFYLFLTRSDSVRCQRRWGSGCARAVSKTRASARQTPLDIHETRGPRAIPPSLRMWSGKPGTILLLRLHFLLSRDFRVARAVCRVGFVGFFSVFLFLFICLTATRFYEQTYRLCVWRPRQLGFCARSPLSFSFSRCIAIYIYRKRERESAAADRRNKIHFVFGFCLPRRKGRDKSIQNFIVKRRTIRLRRALDRLLRSCRRLWERLGRENCTSGGFAPCVTCFSLSNFYDTSQ